MSCKEDMLVALTRRAALMTQLNDYALTIQAEMEEEFKKEDKNEKDNCCGN